MSAVVAAGEQLRAVRFVTRTYARLVLAGFALVPTYLVAYLYFFQDPALKFEHHAFHEIAIAAATLEGLFVTYVTWRCYRLSGEPLLRWMTLGFLGFVLIYALHGAFAGLAHHNIWLFLLYGPASRLVMAILLLVAVLPDHRPPDAADGRMKPRPLLPWIGLFLLMDLAVAYVANSPIAGNLAVRLAMEGGALVFSTVNVTVLLLRRIRSPLMVIFVISLTAFALSSLAFILGRPWNHMWWLAHAIFVGGFFLLSYGAVQAFHTTRSFSTIYSQEDDGAACRGDGAYRERAAGTEAHQSNARASCRNRSADRRGESMAVHRACRSRDRPGQARRGAVLPAGARSGQFKSINDHYGHQVGDDILRGFVQKCLDSIRPFDGVARAGGEEFMGLLLRRHSKLHTRPPSASEPPVAGASFESGMQRLSAVTVSIDVGVRSRR